MTHSSIRARVLPRFPAQVLAGTGITITRLGGAYVFAASAYADIPLTALAPIPTGRVIGRSAPGAGPPSALTVAGGLVVTAAGGIELSPNQRLRGFVAVWQPPGPGRSYDVLIPIACTIRSVTMLIQPAGDVVVDIRKSSYAAFPPTGANSICGGTPPFITGGIKYQNNTLVGWNVNVVAQDILQFYVVSSGAGVTQLAVSVYAETV